MINKFALTLLSLFFCHVAVSANDGIKAFGEPKVSADLVRFAVIGDLTGGERKGVFKVGSEAINKMQPDFILSIGDLIEGGTEDVATLNKEWSVFKRNLNKKGIVFFPTVGNHDISNMVMRDWYTKTVGPRYYHFKHKNVLFLILDSEDFTSEFFSNFKNKRNQAIEVYKQDPKKFNDTEYAKMPERKYGEISREQRDYFLDVIKQNKDVRWTFLLMHKPIWQSQDETNFKQIESALNKQNFTVFNGHVHSYQYWQRNNMDYIQLATTGGEHTIGDGENMDHIMWVSIDDSAPKYLNIKLTGMLDKKGNIPAEGERLLMDEK
ncbi:metallophosphoesterase family protein [Thalassomonas sp. M1454]|uniref:metallophosphoesterase family protein n=1 Tax=Thalassomonas sp. M1454 TaxID=2594477 RepID=UPI00117D7076|nr:metallophosphoesterase family protein [Thalassomonas sp. M1454]TRX54545.1 metallophosphoesterase [Thalassomonas sp. M1454]